MSEVNVCPYCGKKLDGMLTFFDRRRHLDGKCISKQKMAEIQKQRKLQPKLPIKDKSN